jgi:hypothetical protein
MVRVSLTKIRKGIAVRKPMAEVTGTALRMRRMRDRRQQAKLTAAGIEVPPELLNIPLGINGRPPLSDDEINLPEHAAALEWRIYHAAKQVLAQQTEAQQTEPLAVLAAVAEAEPQTATEARAAEALRKLARSLDARNSADGLVADGPRAMRLTATAVMPSVECCIGGSDELCARAYPLRCCCVGICRACLRSWLRRNGERQEVEYGDRAFYAPVDGESPIEVRTSYAQGPRHEGRRYTKVISTHHCPYCRHPVESVRRGLVTCV